ncbi:uncharacterized protein LOC129758375 isoform X2 [Uranotaenia lowii]|uniref:uncharacterized protein LOC129758375 isoform X2 n=1 Tax=Uranotaenia lowii TaxID=190385 RepID=UPI002479D28F|nr:uncharacterized protein LOC129758375 isoform X2 [Uranotaenia lowii]
MKKYLQQLPKNRSLFFSSFSECVICLEPLSKARRKALECCHCFHECCIDEWLFRKKNCPTCRRDTLVTPRKTAIASRRRMRRNNPLARDPTTGRRSALASRGRSRSRSRPNHTPSDD